MIMCERLDHSLLRMLVFMEIIPIILGLTTGNLLRNGDFSQIKSNGQPTSWNVSIGQGKISIQILRKHYLNLNALQISVNSKYTTVMLTQIIPLQLDTNQSLLVMNFWYKTSITYRLASVHLVFYDQWNSSMANNTILHLEKKFAWQHCHSETPIPPNATTVKALIRMHHCMGSILIANMSIEQVDSWTNETFIVSTKQNGTIFIRWNLSNGGIGVARYEIYRGEGILSALNHTNLMVSFPTKTFYGKNIYESTYTDHDVRLDTIYTYQVVARDANGSLLDQTKLAIAQADAGEDYHNYTILIAFPRRDGVHLSWRLRASSAAKYVLLYNGTDRISNMNRSDVQLLGRYPVQDMKAIVSLSNTGPFLLVSNDEIDIATVKLANLTRPRVYLSPTHLAYIKEKIKQPGTANEVYKALKKSSQYIERNTYANYVWPARDAALLYAITKERNYINITVRALNGTRIGHDMHGGDGVRLTFARTVMGRAQAFDWAYEGFTVQDRRDLIRDFQYTASVFSSYSDNFVQASNWVGIIKSGELVQHLALYGEEGYPDDQAERRILFLLNELKLHLEQAYTSSGYTQEGWGYLSYTMRILGPAVYLTKAMGISVLDEAWSRPEWHNLALHSIVLIKEAPRLSLQFGVADTNNQYNGVMTYVFNSTNDPHIKSALRWLYDRTMGIDSPTQVYDGDAGGCLLFYPHEIPAQRPDIVYPRSSSMIIDDIAGFYAFRNRYRDENDVLIAFVSRNRGQKIWNSAETLALSIISHNTIWAEMPGKNFSWMTWKLSTPLIDGKPRVTPSIDQVGYTRVAKAFPGQGGGYVSVDVSVNLYITSARRDLLVDMITRGNIDTIIALQDQFIDNSSHSWYWQLSPESIRTNITLEYENDLSTFVIHGQNKSWLKGWLFNDQNATYNNTPNLLRIIKYGFDANFKIVMALGMGREPIAKRTTTGLDIADVCINFDTLEQGIQCTKTIISIIPDHKTPLILIITIITILISLIVLIIIGILMRKQKNKTNRVASIPSSPVQTFPTKNLDISKIESSEHF